MSEGPDLSAFVSKFGADSDTLAWFLRKCERPCDDAGRTCGAGSHRLGDRAYSYDGDAYNLASHTCGLPECFLAGLDPETVRREAAVAGGPRAAPAGKAGQKAQDRRAARERRAPGGGYHVCYECDRRGTWDELAECRGLGHQTVKFASKKEFDADSKKSHTEYAEDLMGMYNFLTLDDTEEVLYYKDGVYELGGERVIKENAERIVDDCTTAMRNEIINTIRARTYTPRDAFDSDPALICCENCVLNMDTMEALDHDPYLMMRIKIGASYDPDARAPAYEKFIAEVLPDEGERQTMHELFGAVLLRDRVNIEKVAMLVGEGANGKTTLLEAAEGVFGRENVSHETMHRLVNNRFSPSVLESKLANIYADITDTEISNIGVIKPLVSGEGVSAEKKGKDPFVLYNVAKMFFSCNRLPKILEDSDGLYRRFRIIQFLEDFKGRRDLGLKKRLAEGPERSGMLNIFVEAARRIVANDGLTHDIPTDQIRSEWHERADSVEKFAAEHLSADASHSEPKSVVYAAYARFCNRLNLVPKSQSGFTQWMGRLGHEWKKARIDGKSVNAWVGIRLKDGVDASGGTDGPAVPPGAGPAAGRPDTGVPDGTQEAAHAGPEPDAGQEPGADAADGRDADTPGGSLWKCSTCGAGPYHDGATGTGGHNIREMHEKLGHECAPAEAEAGADD